MNMKKYPSRDGRLFSTKEERDYHNAHLPKKERRSDDFFYKGTDDGGASYQH